MKPAHSKHINSVPLSNTFERYAAGLSRKDKLPVSDDNPSQYRQQLVNELIQKNIKGWPEQGTFYTNTLPPGCASCLVGLGSNVCVTTRCTRECFFCFNPKPREDVLSVHGRKISSPQQAIELLKNLGIRSVGISGGEPLLVPNQTLSLIKTLRINMKASTRIDLYTNGDLLTDKLALELKKIGLNSVRINLVANGFNSKPAAIALNAGLNVDVEIPVIPNQKNKLKEMILELDQIGVPHLILHELFSCSQNIDELKRLGFEAKSQNNSTKLTWSPVATSEQVALELLLFALDNAKNLSVYFCSCQTQDWIAKKALARTVS